MPCKTASATAASVILAEFESIGDEELRKHSASVGADGIAVASPGRQCGCRTGDIRKLARTIRTDHELGLKLWKTGNLDAHLLAILIVKPKELSAEHLAAPARRVDPAST